MADNGTATATGKKIEYVSECFDIVRKPNAAEVIGVVDCLADFAVITGNTEFCSSCETIQGC